MAKRNKRTGDYSGVLATPMRFHRYPWKTLVGGVVPEETWRAKQGEAERKNLEQFVERVVALFKHYGVAPGDFVTLAMELAQAHVCGFRFREPGERGRGRPSGTDTAEEIIERVELFREIIPLADKKGLKQACEIISKRRGSRCYGVKPATLRKMVTDAKRASADDLSNLAFRLARFVVDRGIVGSLIGGNDEADAHAGTEGKRRVRRKKPHVFLRKKQYPHVGILLTQYKKKSILRSFRADMAPAQE